MKHILIIDDDEKIRSVFSRFFMERGYTVDCASNGREGLQLLEKETPDLVITDILMPETDGLEVVLALRKTHPDTPVFAISGGMRAAPFDFLPIVKKFGAVRVFKKPTPLADLLAAVEEVLNENEVLGR